MEETIREGEEIVHGEKRKKADEDHQAEAQQKMAKVDPVVEAEKVGIASWANIIQPMESCDPLEILQEEKRRSQ